MTFIYILNFLIPIIFIVSMGFWLDHTCKPDKIELKQEPQRIE